VIPNQCAHDDNLACRFCSWWASASIEFAQALAAIPFHKVGFGKQKRSETIA
jgi:hypothetical protein